MSIAQPENGLRERRVITADSFRALKLRLCGGKRTSAPALLAELIPVSAAPLDLPLSSIPAIDSIEMLPDSAPVSALSHIEEPLAVDSELPAGFETQFEAITASHAIAREPMPEAFETPMLGEPFTAAEEVAAVADIPDSSKKQVNAKPAAGAQSGTAEFAASVPLKPSEPRFVERRLLEKPQPEDQGAGERALALLDIMAVPTSGSLPQERALANDTLLRLIPRMPLRSLRHLAARVCLMEMPSEMLVRRLINDPRIEVSGPLLENATAIHDSDLIAVAETRNAAKLRLIARRRSISPALSEALIQSDHVETLLNLVRNQGACFSIESMWRLARIAAAHPALQAPLVTRQDTPSPIAFQLFWRLPSELRRYVLSRYLTDSETISKILTMNMESEGTEQKLADLSLLSQLAEAGPGEAGGIYARLTQVSEETGARIADDAGGEAVTVALKAAGLTRAQFADVVAKRADAEDLKAIFETLSFNKARVLLTYWDWAARRTGPYARTAAA